MRIPCSTPPKEKGPVFRVTGLPASQLDKKLAASLKATIDNNLTEDERSGPDPSIAIVPSCSDEDEKAALVEFHGGVPAFLAKLTINPQDDWQVEMGDIDINFDQHFFGFTQLYAPKQDLPVTADVIAITGLDGHAYGSWRGKGNLGRMWLREFLCKDLPSCRTMIYGYNSKLSSHGVEKIMDYGRGLMEELKKIRRTEELRRRPLFFIAHSFGGIILAHCLVKAVQAHEDDHPTIASLHKATYGMLLFGIPHKGLVVDDIGKLLAGHDNHPRHALLEQIRRNSDLLASQLADFKNLIRDRKVVSFYETGQTRQLELNSESGRYERTGNFITAVDADSALLHLPDYIEDKIPLDADHSMIVKFKSRNERGYTSARAKLQQFERDAPNVVAGRFQTDQCDDGCLPETDQCDNMHWRVRRPITSLFTGRTELLDRIRSVFRVRNDPNSQKQQRFVITGMGGLGKSEVCLQIANLLREDFWGVFWVDVSGPSTAKNDFVAIAKALGSTADSIEEALQVLTNAKQRWLLILDNADDPEVDYTAYFPPGTRGAVIMTSRIPECRRYSTVGVETLEHLDLKDSTQLLLKAAGYDEPSWASHEKEAQDVVELLSSHTLALIQAGAYIAEGHCRLDQYPEKYKRQRKRLLKHYPEQEQSRYQHVYATFEASVKVLARSHNDVGKDALDLLSTLAMMHFSVLPLRVFEDAWSGSRKVLERNSAGSTKTDKVDELTPWHVSQLPELLSVQVDEWDDYRLGKASSRLVSLSLVTRHNSGSFYGLSMHPLTHAWAKDRLEKTQQHQVWLSTGCLIALSRKQSSLWQVHEKELQPHMQSFVSAKVDPVLSYVPRKAMLPILLACGWILNTMREDGRLERLIGDIYDEYQIRPSEPAEEYLPVWDLVASNMGYMGEAKQAVGLLEHVVKVRETTLKENHPDRLASEGWLSHICSTLLSYN